MKSAAEKHADWMKYADGLGWVKGNLDQASWWTFLRAGSCGIEQNTALDEVAKRIQAAGGSARSGKLQSQCRRAYAFAGQRVGAAWSPRPAYDRREKPKFDDTKLKEFAAEWSPHVDEVWLGNRSAVDPATVSAGEFLDAIYEVGEQVLLFSVFASQGQMFWKCWADKWAVAGADLGGDYTDNFVETLGGPDGVWFLAQPVDGQSHPNPRERADGEVKMSRRSMESVTSWRYLVLESDTAAARDWLGALVQLPLRIAAIYTSGGKSIHALVRVDAASKAHWDAFKEMVAATLVILGADPAAMTAVRLTRLPGCTRGTGAEKRLQKLLYLDPRPSSLRPICARAPKRDVVAEWLRYAEAASCDDPSDDHYTGDLRAKAMCALRHYAPANEILRQKLEVLA